MKHRSPKEPRRLGDLGSVGPRTVEDFRRLGISTVAQLARKDPRKLYERLCAVTGCRQDPCCEDVFSAAIAQARDPRLPAEKRRWWYWSRVRKSGARTAGDRSSGRPEQA